MSVDAAPGIDAAPVRSSYFTAPGLELEILDARIFEDGVATTTFRITDEEGTPLDLDGLYTEGEVVPRFVLARLETDAAGEPAQYTAYTTRPQESPITGETAIQASADAEGTFTEIGVAQGTYLYTFATPILPTDVDLTHTVGVYATREFGGERYVANALHHFVPVGGPVVTTREVVRTENCNECHGRLEAHGGARRETALCILCHQPQTVDPDTRNTVDFEVMVHKIHRGENLPSVAAGTPYQIIGFGQTVFDFSTVVFPQEIERCVACHAGAQGEAWRTRPSRAACGSCHDLIDFESASPRVGMTPHPGGPQRDDSTCTACHSPSGGISGITEAHLGPSFDPNVPTLDLTILGVTNTGPGEAPTMDIRVASSGTPIDILTSPLVRLGATVAGPTTDYATFWQVTLQGAGAAGTLAALDAAAGTFRYQFPSGAAIPATATGSYAVGLEGTLQTDGPTGPRVMAVNPVAFVAVTDETPVPRRTVVDRASCNRCHFDLAAHGGVRKDPDYCVLCHNPNNVNDERVARVEGTSVVAQSLHLKVMIHKIHAGEDLTQPYVLGGFPVPSAANPAGTPVDFGEVRFPGDLRVCETCHLEGTFDLPLPKNLLPSREDVLDCTEPPTSDANQLCDARVVGETRLTPPQAAACTTCHDAPETAAHAEVMTGALGVESCATCHAAGMSFGVDVVHRRGP